MSSSADTMPGNVVRYTPVLTFSAPAGHAQSKLVYCQHGTEATELSKSCLCGACDMGSSPDAEVLQSVGAGVGVRGDGGTPEWITTCQASCHSSQEATMALQWKAYAGARWLAAGRSKPRS